MNFESLIILIKSGLNIIKCPTFNYKLTLLKKTFKCNILCMTGLAYDHKLLNIIYNINNILIIKHLKSLYQPI